jgi:excinuclease ABC subunit A
MVEIPENRRKPNGKWVEVIKANENNLKNIDAAFPLGVFTCVTGVSGSGKSTLVNEILFKALSHKLNGSKQRPGSHKTIKGVSHDSCPRRFRTKIRHGKAGRKPYEANGRKDEQPENR